MILPLFGLDNVLSFVMVYTERLVLSLHFTGSREWSEFFGQISKQCEAKSKQSSFSCELLKIAENIQSRRVANLKFLVKSPIILRTL